MELRNLTLRQFQILSAGLLVIAGVVVVAGYLVAGSRIGIIREAWTDLQAVKSDRSALQTALTQSLGYGGMIHNFKNFVLRKEFRYHEAARGHIGAAKSLIGRYRALQISHAEKRALDDIATMISAYDEALSVSRFLAASGTPSLEIDSEVRIDDRPALDAIATLHGVILERQQELGATVSKSIQATRLRTALGYGGLIHGFKNYILRRDQVYADRVQRHAAEAQRIIEGYKALDISPSERLALEDIAGVIELYRFELQTVRNFMAANRPSENIDLAVRVNDKPALEGLRVLDRQIALENNLKTRDMGNALSFLEDTGFLIVSVTCAVLLALMVISGWLLHRLVTAPVKNMTGAMTHLADGKFAVEVPGTDMSNEIGEMARAVAVFRENAVERLAAETELSEAHHLITESVQYASRIQRSLLPPEDILASSVDEHFIIWEPKDVVGGDLFWVKRDKKGCMIVLFDCTGHGVPGALMTTIAVSAIDHAFDETGDPARLIRQVHQRVQVALNQDGEEGLSDDGLEMGVCLVERERRRLTFAGARFELLVCQKGETEIIKGTRAGCGYRRFPLDQGFQNHVLKIEPGMTFTMFSDGATDQIGGEKRRMFGKKRLRRTLSALSSRPLDRQGADLLDAIRSYQGEESRRDDLSVISFRPIAGPV